MRRALGLVVLAALAGQATAREVEEPRMGRRHYTKDFWRDAIDPHAVEVEELLAKATDAVAQADSTKASDLDATSLETRDRVYSDVFHMMLYARKLSPSEPRVLLLLAHVADEIGNTRQATEALTTLISQVGPDKAGQEATGRLGRIYLRMNMLDDAVRWLRISRASKATVALSRRYSGAAWSEQDTLVYLATALALRGEGASAIEVVTRPTNGYGEALVPFALAVMLDRDDQRSAAFEQLDALQTKYSSEYANQLQTDLATFDFAPVEDRHYFQALFYESLGMYTEARAEWVHYASATDSRHRARALEHVAAIDKEKRAPTQHAPGIRPVPPPYVRPKITP